MSIPQETAMKIERDLVSVLIKTQEKLGITDSFLGEAAFQGTVNGRRKIQNLKNVQVNGQPQRLSIADFVRICKPLGLDPARVLGRVLDENSL